MRGGLLAAVGLAALAVGGTAAAQTETLGEALAKTYDTNPTIMAQRANVRAADEGVAVARSRGRPTVTGTGGFTEDVVTTNLGDNGRGIILTGDVSVPLWQGGRVRNAVRAANSRVQVGRADLRAVEGDIFTEAVAAYMDVIRDRSIVSLNQNQVRVLETNLQATRDRFEVGDLTRTDVAQSEARLALARSTLSTVEGRLETSEENFLRVIGDVPAPDLQPPPELPRLPTSPDQAVEIALANNADLQSIAAQARAAGYDVAAARSERLPTISGVSRTTYNNALGTAPDSIFGASPNSTTSVGVGLSARVPIYQGGLASALVRQSQAVRTRILEQAIGIERLVVANARSAFAVYQAALRAIESNTIAVAANELALEGTRAEQTVGTRNVLDVLNAEQELLNSQVALVSARRDAYVAGFQLLNVMGYAEAEDLNLQDGPLYDPAAHYNRYSNSWSDWNDGPRAQPVATRTVGPTAISPINDTRPVGSTNPNLARPPAQPMTQPNQSNPQPAQPTPDPNQPVTQPNQ